MNLDEHLYVSQSILALAHWYCIFHISCTTVYFHTVISVFRNSIYAVFVVDRPRKQTLLIKTFLLKIYHPPVRHTYKLYILKRKNNIPWVTWYTLNYKIAEVYFEAPKMYTNQWNNICNGVHFFVCSFTENMLLDKCFSRFLLR